MNTKLRPEAIAAKPATAPIVVASVPSGGSAGRSMPTTPSSHADGGVRISTTRNSVTRMNRTSTQNSSSRVREIFLPNRVIAKTAPMRPTPIHRVVVRSPPTGMSPVTRVKKLAPAEAAQPPVMNAR
jgi:hypothetical protein